MTLRPILSLSRFAAFVVMGFLCLPPSCSAEDPAVQIVEQRQGDTFLVVAKLTNALDVTITLNGETNNLAPSATLPVTVESAGKSEVPILTLRIVDRRKPSHYSYRIAWRAGGRQRATIKPFAYALPYRDGPHRVLQAFFGSFSHGAGSQDEYAVDFAMPIGTSVHAARAGTVVAFRSDVEIGGPTPRFRPDYNYVVIRHDDGTYAEYVHLDKDGVKVHLGESVAQGALLGLSGETGFTSEPHLHFAVFNTVSGHERRTAPIEFLLASGRHVAPQQGRSY